MARIEIVGERRRAHGAEFRARVVAECLVPGARMRDLARRYGICTSLIYRWRRSVLPLETAVAAVRPEAAGPMPPGKAMAAGPALEFTPIGVLGRSDDGGSAGHRIIAGRGGAVIAELCAAAAPGDGGPPWGDRDRPGLWHATTGGRVRQRARVAARVDSAADIIVIAVAPGTKVYLACRPVSMRFGFDGLATLAAGVLNADPFSGHLFLFHSKRADYLKCLY